MSDWATALMMLTGAVFTLLAAIGVLRLPDLFTRMQASTKAGTVGVGLVMLAVAVHFGEFGISVRALLIVSFLLLTAPVGAHVIGRAAHLGGVATWKGTTRDELRDGYRDGSSNRPVEAKPDG